MARDVFANWPFPCSASPPDASIRLGLVGLPSTFMDVALGLHQVLHLSEGSTEATGLDAAKDVCHPSGAIAIAGMRPQGGAQHRQEVLKSPCQIQSAALSAV